MPRGGDVMPPLCFEKDACKVCDGAAVRELRFPRADRRWTPFPPGTVDLDDHATTGRSPYPARKTQARFA
jgi:hypothetical protein